MSDKLFMAKMPMTGTFALVVARYLLANAPRYSGVVPLVPFFDRYNTATLDQVSHVMSRLRIRYGYFCRMSTVRHLHVDCAMEWPMVTRHTVWDEKGNYKLKDSKPVVFDPRLHESVIKWRYRSPKRGTVVYMIAVWLLRNRDQFHTVDAGPLFAKFGFRRVRNCFNTLNKKCGFEIKKFTNSSVHDCYYTVHRHRNIKILPSAS